MLTAIRYVLPGVVVLAGVLAMVIGGNDDALEGGGAIVGAGLAIYLMNVLFRIGVTGDHERDDEDAARTFFDRHGHWPDEQPPATPAPRPAPAERPPGRPPPGRLPRADASRPRRRGG